MLFFDWIVGLKWGKYYYKRKFRFYARLYRLRRQIFNKTTKDIYLCSFPRYEVWIPVTVLLLYFFSNRIDGMSINITSNSSRSIVINNGTVLLDRQRRFTYEAEETNVALISLQYDAGEYAKYIITLLTDCPTCKQWEILPGPSSAINCITFTSLL